MTEQDYRALVSDLADQIAYHAGTGFPDEQDRVLLCRAWDAGWRPHATVAAHRLRDIVGRRRLIHALAGEVPHG